MPSRKDLLMQKRAKPDFNFAKDGVSASFLLQFLQCREMAKITLERWSPIVQSGPAQFGTLAHDVLRRCYGKARARQKPPKADAMADIARLEVAKAVEQHRTDQGARWGETEMNRLYLQEAQLYALLPAYFEYWWLDGRKFEWFSLEDWFRVPFEGTHLKGRWDAAFKLRSEYWLWENKTMARIDETAISEILGRDFQSMFYKLVFHLLYEKTPAGSYYNILRRPGQELKKGEHLQQYTTRIVADIKRDPEHYFKRFEVPTSERELEDFRIELSGLLKEVRGWVEAGYPTSRYGMPCVNKYGLCWNSAICYRNDLSRFVRYQKKGGNNL